MATSLNSLNRDLDIYAETLTGWSSYTPTFTIDGSACSSTVRGVVIRYKKIGKTVYLQGAAIFGEAASGGGGTFVKMSTPIPGKTGVSQFGIGAIGRATTLNGLATVGTGAIVSTDLSNFILTKMTGGFWTAGDAPLNAGFFWDVVGQYEID